MREVSESQACCKEMALYGLFFRVPTTQLTVMDGQGGSLILPGDRYCRWCGAQLTTEESLPAFHL